MTVKGIRIERSRGTSLVAQWLRIHLPMQGSRVRALTREDPTCHRAAKPVHHNYRACTLEPMSHNHWAHVPPLLKPVCLEPGLCKKEATAMRSLHTATKSSPCSPQLEKACAQPQRPNAAKKKKKKLIYKEKKEVGKTILWFSYNYISEK